MSAEEKAMLRKEAIRHRNRIDPGSENIDKISDIFMEALSPKKGQIVSFYWPKGRELHTGALVERLTQEGIILALPVVKKDTKILEFYKWDEGTALKKGAFDIMEPDIQGDDKPVLPDIIIVPLLAFDRKGHRLGYGGGYYDATIEHLRKTHKTVAVGLAYAQQAVLFNLPSEGHDQSLDWIITPIEAHDHRQSATAWKGLGATTT